ncbi:porin family protein [Viscerimonas tarda]
MKERVFILALFVFLTSTINSQSEFVPEWNIGAGFGPTFSTVSFDPAVNTKNLNQFHGGVAVRYVSEKNLGVIAELNYSQQGWEGSFKEQPEFKHSHSLTYLEVPVMTHIYFGKKVRFFVNLGPKMQFLIGEKEEMSDELADYLANEEEIVFAGNALQRTGQYNKNVKYLFDYGLTGGLGLELRSKIGNFALEGRYYAGFADLFDNHTGNSNFNRSANRVMSAKLTYYIKAF